MEHVDHVPSFLESLESRIAPATLVDGSTVTFNDTDGDAVTLTFGKDIFTDAASMAGILIFSPGASGGETLNTIDLGALAGKSLGRLDITLHADQVGGGDGKVNLGFLNAAGRDLGDVTIDGALAKIIAGNGALKSCAVKTLTVDSFGLAGSIEGSSLGAVTSTIFGKLCELNVAGDFAYALLSIEGESRGQIGEIHIGGSILGGSHDESGLIKATGRIGSLVIDGSIIGGAGEVSGGITSGKSIGEMTIAGSIVGGAGDYSGSIISGGRLGDVLIGDNIVGGSGHRSGFVQGHGIDSITVEGDITGGSDYGAGRIESTGKVGKIFVAGTIQGGTDEYTGSIFSTHHINKVTVHDLNGTAFRGTGAVFGERSIGKVTVDGNLTGGAGEASGYIQASNRVHHVSVDGNLTGGSGLHSGSILCFKQKMGPIHHEGTETHGSGSYSGVIQSLYSPYRSGTSGSYGISVSYGAVFTMVDTSAYYDVINPYIYISPYDEVISNGVLNSVGSLSVTDETTTYTGGTIVNSGSLTVAGSGSLTVAGSGSGSLTLLSPFITANFHDAETNTDIKLFPIAGGFTTFTTDLPGQEGVVYFFDNSSGSTQLKPVI